MCAIVLLAICGSPLSKLFTNYAEAYAHFLIVSHAIDRERGYYAEADHFVNTSYDPNSANDRYTIIEYMRQKGHWVGGCNYAKRHDGALIARYKM